MQLYYLQAVGKVLYYGVCLAAAVRGDRPLRYAGVAIVAGSLVSPLMQRRDALDQPQYGVMVADVALLAFMSVVLIRDKRWWLVAATGFLLMSFLTHFAALFGSPIRSYVIYTVRLAWCFAMVLAVGWGLVQHELCKWRAGREGVGHA
jgi:hypothetical protein